MEKEELCCSCSLRQCRICHEEEDEGCTSMESPCACSGSLKYAHSRIGDVCRDGAMRRGAPSVRFACRISSLATPFLPRKLKLLLMLQSPSDKMPCTVAHLYDRVLHSSNVAKGVKTVSSFVLQYNYQIGSLEVPRLNYEPEDAPLFGPDAVVGDPDYAECACAAGRSASWCRSVAVTFTVVLLLRHLMALVTVGAANQYAFSLLTIYMLRASGILLPFYVVMRLISAVQQGQRQYRLQLLHEQRRNASRMIRLQGQEHQQHVILVR